MKPALPLPARVFALLAAGGFHSGADLARVLRVSRSAVWKAVGELRALGLGVHAVRSRGYRLAVAVTPLAAAALLQELPPQMRARVRSLEARWSIDSTNAELLRRTELPAGRADVLLAEHQLAGRGRRGRSWFAPPGGAICLSVGWSFAQLPRDVGSLSLAVGVCALRALAAYLPAGAAPPLLKWPNDLVSEGRKLGGILIELRAESGGPGYAVIGIGINAALGPQLLQQIAATGTEPADLAGLGVDPRARARVAASLIESIIEGLRQFERGGLSGFIAEWRRADALMGRAVRVLVAEHPTYGIARGIDADGALLVETPRGLKRFISGEVSVRAEP